MSDKVYLGDIGTVLRLNTGIALVGATVTKIKVIKPDGTTDEYDASIVESTKIQYAFVSGDIDQTGVWYVQAYVEIDDWKGRGETAEFTVYPVFE